MKYARLFEYAVFVLTRRNNRFVKFVNLEEFSTYLFKFCLMTAVQTV
jgi:hypothetical protein